MLSAYGVKEFSYVKYFREKVDRGCNWSQGEGWWAVFYCYFKLENNDQSFLKNNDSKESSIIKLLYILRIPS